MYTKYLAQGQWGRGIYIIGGNSSTSKQATFKFAQLLGPLMLKIVNRTIERASIYGLICIVTRRFMQMLTSNY